MAHTTPQKYLVLGERAAQVDDVVLTPGGDARELTDEQVTRLTGSGIEIELADADGAAKPVASLKKAEAVARAEAAGLDTDGTLAEIVERLEAQEADASDETTSTEGGDS